MTEPDMPDSVPPAPPSGQDPVTEEYTPDPPAAASGMKRQGDDSPAAKDNENWVTRDEPMTGPQASYLETLAQQAGEPVPTGLSKAQASEEIERLQAGSDPTRQERPTETWVTGEEPMTGPQASYLETLAQQTGEPVPEGLTKSQASRAIEELRARAGR